MEKLQTEEVVTIMQYSRQNGMEIADVAAAVENQMSMYADQLAPEQVAEMEANMQSLKNSVPVAEFIDKAIQEDHFSQDRKWIRHITYEERQMLKEKAPECGVEPDFYYMSRELFHNGIMVLLYLVTFVVLFMHLRHAFPSAFQTLGLNNYKYNTAIEVCGQIYTWIITLGFAAVPILVFLGL